MKYNAAARTASLISFVLVAVNCVTAPKFSIFHSQGNIAALSSAAIQSTNLMMLVVSPALVVCFFFPDWMMGIFGERFATYGNILAILAFGQAIDVATGSAGILLTMSGQEKLLRHSGGKRSNHPSCHTVSGTFFWACWGYGIRFIRNYSTKLDGSLACK